MHLVIGLFLSFFFCYFNIQILASWCNSMGRQTRALFLPCETRSLFFLLMRLCLLLREKSRWVRQWRCPPPPQWRPETAARQSPASQAPFVFIFQQVVLTTQASQPCGFQATHRIGREKLPLSWASLAQCSADKGLTLFAGSCKAAPTSVSNHFPRIPASVATCWPTRVRVSTNYFPAEFQALSRGRSLLSHSINCISHLALRLNITSVSCPNLVSSSMLLGGNRSLALNCLRLGFSIRYSQCRVNCGYNWNNRKWNLHT